MAVVASTPRNIVQAEFFHVGKGAPSLQAVASECAERAIFGSPIKTVVRFLDVDGSMTRFALKFTEVEKKCRELATDSIGPGYLQRMFARWKHHRLVSKKVAMMNERKPLALRQLTALMGTFEQVAMEQRNHSFLLLRHDERHELLESARAAVDVWLFVFQPRKNLLADSNTLIARVM